MCGSGLYIATAGEDKVVAVWDVQKSECIAQETLSGIATDLQWHPEANEIILGLATGKVVKWSNAVPASLTGPAEKLDADTMMESSFPGI